MFPGEERKENTGAYLAGAAASSPVTEAHSATVVQATRRKRVSKEQRLCLGCTNELGILRDCGGASEI